MPRSTILLRGRLSGEAFRVEGCGACILSPSTYNRSEYGGICLFFGEQGAPSPHKTGI
jgi:hypothetical protein